MMRSSVWWLLLLAAALAVTPALAADGTGSLAGTVRDAETLQPLAEMRVNIVDMELWQIGAWTGPDGSYVIEDIPVGTYPFDALGWDYDSTRVEDVSILEGQTTTVDFLISHMNPRRLVRAVDVTHPWPDADCLDPAVTPDGRYVVFESAATNLVLGDTNGQSDVFLLDCDTNQLTLISKAADGTPANGGSTRPSISADGQYVGFNSEATNLLPGLTVSQKRGYLYDRETGTLTLATVGDGGAIPDDYASGRISADGRHYYFASYATNLDPTDASDGLKLFMRNLTSGRTWRVDLGFDGSPANGEATVRAFTPDGRYLLFDSLATNLVPDDTNSGTDQFVYDALSGALERADLHADGSQIEYPASSGMGSAISGDGRYVAFSAENHGLWPDLLFDVNMFMRDRAAGTTELVGILYPSNPWSTLSTTQCFPMSMSADGRLVAFYLLQSGIPMSGGPVDVRDRVAARTVTCPWLWRELGNWAFSANGRFLIGSTREDSHDPYVIWLWEPELLQFGTLQGTVRDDTGAPVPHADLWIGDGLYMRADAAGAFSIDVPATESTTLRVSADGYVATSVDGLAITEGETVPVDVTLSREFSDVGDESWAEQSVSDCLEAGIVGGYADSSYHPSESVTRGQMAVYIARALAGGDGGVAPPRPGTQSFSDVPADHWAFRYIESCSAESVVQGYSDGSYKPDDTVNRGQMAVYIARAMVSPTGDAAVPDPPAGDSTFTDVNADNEWSWCEKHVEYLASQGIVQGYTDGSYHPAEAVTRDQMAVYIQRAFQLPM
jgi:hypothetical protein